MGMGLTLSEFIMCRLILLAVVVACGGDENDATPTTPADSGLVETDTADCAVGCEATLEAACPNGPASQAVCEADCEALLAGACGAEYGALVACGQTSTVSCDPAMGYPIVDDCPNEQSAVLACLNG